MVNPVSRNGNFVQGAQPGHKVQPIKVSGGLADVPTIVDQRGVCTTLVQTIINFFRRIYRVLVSIVNALKQVLRRLLFKETAPSLYRFNNPKIKGQINGIYIATNETNLDNTRQLLREQPRPATETIHIGCATWHNLDIICARKSDHGLIVDFNPKNAEFMRKTIGMIVSCVSRDSFKTSMIRYLNSLSGRERDLFFHRDQKGLPTDRIEKELSREGSWLESDESYLYIKRLASKDRLVPITEDITNFEKFSSIRKFLDSNNIAIDTLYVSNICNFMNTSTKRIAYEKSIKQLLNSNTIFIHCPKIRFPHPTILNQRAILGKEVLSSAQLFEE